MPKNKAMEGSNPGSVEREWSERGEIAATRAVIAKYARVLDMTDSGRDIKPLATGFFDAIDRLNALEAARSEDGDTPYAQIMREAEAALANA